MLTQVKINITGVAFTIQDVMSFNCCIGDLVLLLIRYTHTATSRSGYPFLTGACAINRWCNPFNNCGGCYNSGCGDWTATSKEFGSLQLLSYHQSDEDTDYLIFSCGKSLGGTPGAWAGDIEHYCGLFNTSGDTEPEWIEFHPYIGSRTDIAIISAMIVPPTSS